MILVDTDVLVDIVRQYSPAVQWLEQLGSADVTLPGFVVMELIEGCRSRTEQRRVECVIEPYEIIWPSEQTCDKALAFFAHHYLTYGLGILNAVIGQIAVDADAPLATFNRKHYSTIPGLKTLQPYPR